MTLAPLCAFALFSGIGLAGSLRPASPLFLRLYLGFVVLASLAGFPAVIFSGSHYASLFFSVDIAHNLILCGLSLEVIRRLLPKKFVAFWGAFLLGVMAVTLLRGLPAANIDGLLNLSISADMTAGLLLVALAFSDNADWTSSAAWTVAGIAGVLLGSALPEISWIHGNISALAVQLGTLPGLIVLTAAAWMYRQTPNIRHKSA